MNFKYKDIVIKKGIEHPDISDLWQVTGISKGKKCEYYYTIVPFSGMERPLYKSISDKNEENWINANFFRDTYPEFFI